MGGSVPYRILETKELPKMSSKMPGGVVSSDQQVSSVEAAAAAFQSRGVKQQVGKGRTRLIQQLADTGQKGRCRTLCKAWHKLGGRGVGRGCCEARTKREKMPLHCSPLEGEEGFAIATLLPQD